MEKKYLLYIDILGFSNLVIENSMQVRRLYNIIEALNVHSHHAFNVIVFSDTILVYNNVEPITEHDHRYLVMYQIEFAQNLLYETIGKGYYFRSVLVYGTFEHVKRKNIEQYFGKALIRAHSLEKTIQCTGLFIDRHCSMFNRIFPIEKYNDNLNFVFMMQSFDRLNRGDLGPLPIDSFDLWNSDSQWDLAEDVRMFKDIYFLMKSHPDPKVRKKLANTWKMYCRRYSDLLKKLVKGNFELSIVSPEFNWADAISRIRHGFKGFGIAVPSLDVFRRIISKARKEGSRVAHAKLRELTGDNPEYKMLAPCGGAFIILDVDRRSELGKFLISAGISVKNLSVSKDSNGLRISIIGMHHRQERIIDEVASHAALSVLKEELHIDDGYVESYYD